MRRYLILAVIAAAALIWPRLSVLAQPVAGGLNALAPATAIHDSDTLPLCQNGAPSCSVTSYVWSLGNLGQIAANFAQRTQTVTNHTLSCSANVCTNIPSSALVATGVSAGTYTNANITVNAAGQITAASNGFATVSKTANYTIVAGDNGTCFDNGGATGTVVFTLPAYAAGFNVCFIVMSAHILEVLAPTGVQIAMAPNITAAAGNVQDTTLYDTLSLIAPASGTTVWVTRSFEGTGWSLN
jgi:hypothetical protein